MCRTIAEVVIGRIFTFAVLSPCRLLVWPQVPLLTRTELAKLKGEEPLEPHLSDADSKHQPPCGCAVDVLLGKDGYITCTRLPNPSTLPLQPFSPGGGIAAERLVTATALDCAALQLAGIQAVLLEDDSLRQELGATWMADLDTGAAPEGMDGNVPTTLAQPVLRLGVGGDTCATVQINPKTGAPVLCLGHSLAEDGTVVDRARSIVQLAQQALTQGIEDARVGPLEKDVSRGTACVSAAARSIGAALKELAFERRKAACASAAFAAGFLRTPLPAILQSPQPPAGEKYDSVATLALGVPRFPSPLGLPEQMPVADRGSLLGLLLIDMSTLPPAAAAIRCGLALLTATPRGIPAGLHSVVQLPEKLLAVKVSAEAPAPSSRKRKGRESESVPLESKPLYDASNGKTATAAQGHLLDLDWGGIMTCSLELLAQEQLNAQIKALGLSLAESKAGHEFTLKDVPGLQKALLDLEAAEEGRELKGYAVTIKLDPSVPARGLFAVALPEPGKAPRESEGLLMNGDARRDDTLKGTVTYGAVPVLGYALAEGHCVADAIIDVVSYLKAQTLLAKLATALEGVEDLGVKRQSRVKPERLGHAAFKFTVAVPDGKDADVAPVEVTLTWGPGASSAAKDGENGADLLTVGCKVAAQPALPAVMLSSLASIADGNDVELLLDVIGHLAAPAAVLQAAALEPAAQYAAGLMPGALNVERCTLVTQDNPDGSLPLGTSDGVKQRSPGCLQCLMLVRQLGRALQLGVWISSESIIMRIRHIPPIPAFPEGASWLAAALGRAREGTGCQERLETDEAGTHAVFEINASELAVVLKVMLEAVAGKDA